MTAQPSGKIVSFDIQTPVDSSVVRDQVLLSRNRGIREADDGNRWLNIVANGPSAKDQDYFGNTLALNGALSLFPEDRPPTYWAACDPQPLVADFIGKDPPLFTQYLVASKCHSSVFEALEHRNVKLWHINDCDLAGPRTVPCAVSVTLCAMMLMQRLGYRRFEIYGWDCCLGEDGSHHAGASVAPAANTIDLEVGDKIFKTNSVWAAEAQDAMGIIPVLEWCGVEVNIHGNSMIQAIREYTKS